MTENWIEFRRVQCKNGFIDHYIGDTYHNPNLSSKPHMQVNSFSTWFRLNGIGKWLHSSCFEYCFWNTIVFKGSELDITKFWNDSLINTEDE